MAGMVLFQTCVEVCARESSLLAYGKPGTDRCVQERPLICKCFCEYEAPPDGKCSEFETPYYNLYKIGKYLMSREIY